MVSLTGLPAKMVSPGDKTVPQKSTILRGLGIVLAYSHFKWSDFMMGAHVSSRFKVFLEQAIRDGKLKTGHWQKQTWLGFAVLSRLVSSFLAHKIQHGTHNWDIQIAKCLSLVLVAALGARSGDVSRSHRYTGQQFLQYRHINLHLVGSQPILANLRATITLEFCKNHKLADNEETQYYFSPLGKVEHNHMCPIAWLLVHALRHSLVADASLQDVLNRAFARTDRQVEWLYPSRPVLASIDQRSEAMIHIDLDKPAGAQQLLRSTKEMGVLAGMLDRAYTHAIRLGHARDIAQLPTNAPVGYNTDHVRQSLGHTAKSSYKGVTDNYIGGLHTEVYTLRAQHSSQPQGRIPRFVTPDGKLESRAMTAEKLKSGPTTTTPLPEISRHRHPLADKDVNIPTTNASKAAAPYHPLQNVDPALLTEDELADVATTVPTPAADELYSTVFPESALGSNAEADMDNIDSDKNNATAVLDVFSNADAQAALQSLADKSGAEEDEALFVTDENPAPIYSTAEIFITTYSKVNEVSTQKLACAWESSDNDVIAKATETHCISGGSREPPRPKIHTCNKTPGCEHTSYALEYLKVHEVVCSPELVARFTTAVSLADETSAYACIYDGCDYKPAPGTNLASVLRSHVLKMHLFEPRPCKHGCDPATVYNTKASYDNHVVKTHVSGYPARCIFPGCTSTAIYSTKQALERHLTNAHKLEVFGEREPYLPPPKPKYEYVADQTCWINGCEQELHDRTAVIRHLKSAKHDMTLEEAQASYDANAQFNMVAGTHARPKKRAFSAREVERQQAKVQKKTKTDD